MWNSNLLAAIRASWTGSSKAKSSHFYHIKSGTLAEARENVKRVHDQVARFERSCARRELDETHPTKRIVNGFFAAVRHHERALTGYSEDDVEAMDSLEHASNDLVTAASTLYAIDPALYQAKVGVSLLAGVRGLDSKEAFERYLADLEMIAEDRRERAARREKVKTEGYTDANGKKHSAADVAAKAESNAAWHADPMASRLSETGQGRQDEAANNESMRSLQDRRVGEGRRRRCAIDAAHAARNALPPPTGAERHVDGYKVMSYIAGELENPPTWDRAEIARRVAEFRERNGVPERDRRVYGTYVCSDRDGYRVLPPVAMLRTLRVKEQCVYNPATRSCSFRDEDEAVVAYEKFMAPSTSDDERKAMMRPPHDAYICAHCGKRFVSKKQSAGIRLRARQSHERSCAERSSSSEEEESDEDEDEPEEDGPEEVVAAPQPKRARFWGSW